MSTRDAATRPLAPLNPAIDEAGDYPFARLQQRLQALKPADLPLISFSAGDPREVTSDLVRDALRAAVPEVSSYPPTFGTPELRRACADFVARRFGVTLDPDAHVLSLNGSKEGVYTLPHAVVARAATGEGGRDTVVIPSPSYPVYRSGAAMAGARVHFVPLTSENGWRFDPARVPDEVWARTALLWINSPHNPTGATLSRDELARVTEIARRHGFWVGSDEAYIEVYFGEKPASILECGLDNVLALHSLSKRSAMTGYRSGFMAGDPRLIAAMRRLRPHLGVGTPEFVQQAAVAAWRDDAHAERQRAAYAAKRDLFLATFARYGWRIEASTASFYLWLAAPDGDDLAFVDRLMRIGIVASPGSFFGDPGKGFVRWALVPTLEQCREAVARIDVMEARA